MKKESRDRMNDMISLMDDGYGKSVVCFDDLLNTALSVFHEGGTNAIVKSTNAWIEVITSIAKISIGIRVALNNCAPDLDVSNIKTSDMIKVDIRYMESSHEAGMRLEIRAGVTGNERLDMLLTRVVPILLSDDVNSISIVE